MKVDKKYRLSFTKKASEIVKKMSLEEKVALMSGTVNVQSMLDDFSNPNADRHYNCYPYEAGGNKKYDIPSLKFCDGPRGVVTEKSTCFPVTMARGASFNTKLETEVGKAIGREIRAYDANFFGGVCINLPYNPGWGRSQEVYGEDDFHLGKMGSALVEGVQNENVIACIKHFAFNSMENSRFDVSVEADKRTEREVYLNHFKMCIDSGAASVMSAYNKYQGEYCGENKYLLTDVLRDEWDFDGFVVSDFAWGIRSTVPAVNAGLDIEMPNTNHYGEKLVKAVLNGEVDEELINKSATRIIRTLLAFKEAEDPQEYPRKVIGCVEHIELAKKVAEESITLIKNDGNLLPFSKDESKSIAVLGELGNTENIGDHGSSRVFPAYVVTPLAGITKEMPNASVTYNSGKNIDEAIKVAQNSDRVILVAGYRDFDEGEYVEPNEELGVAKENAIGGDRKDSLGLHDDEIELIKAVAKVNKNVVVVLIGGNMIRISEWSDLVPSILLAYYPGMEGGTAISEIIFGDVNPSGKLPFVVVKEDNQLPKVKWISNQQTYDYYHGYAKLEKENIIPDYYYGFGLSYTDFAISERAVTIVNDTLTASCKISNIGDREGKEVVQLYLGVESGATVDRPIKKLQGFEKVSLARGESKTIDITCPLESLKYYSDEGWKFEEGVTYAAYIGTSSNPKDLEKLIFTI